MPVYRRLPRTLLCLWPVFSLAACLPDPARGILPDFDLRPPAILEAGPSGPRGFALRFDEEVLPVAGSFALAPEAGAILASVTAVGITDDTAAGVEQPGLEPVALAGTGGERLLAGGLSLSFGRDLVPGTDYALVGEAEDPRGNRTRFLFRFAGWNAHPARLMLAEVEPQKNSSTTRPHRDFLEFEVALAGNLGGLDLAWASSARAYAYRFPGVEVGPGERIVLHLAPEGLTTERDETGTDLGLSGGIDASSAGRDLWSKAGGLPDENGVILLRDRPGGELMDALFYADSARTGALGDDRLGSIVTGLVEEGAWPMAGAVPAWEDAFRWKPGSSRSLCREGGPAAPESWRLSEASAQSPGLPNPP